MTEQLLEHHSDKRKVVFTDQADGYGLISSRFTPLPPTYPLTKLERVLKSDRIFVSSLFNAFFSAMLQSKKQTMHSCNAPHIIH